MAKLYPDRGQMLPDFTLFDSVGRQVGLDSYRQRTNLVMVLVDGEQKEGEAELLDDLARHYSEVADEEAEVLAVIRGGRVEADRRKREMGLPYPVLADEDGRVHATLGAMAEDGSTVPALYVADRFGEIYSAFRGEGGVPLPSGEEVLTWLRFIEHQCPE